MRNSKTVVFVLLYIFCVQAEDISSEDVVVHLNNGDLRGEKMIGEKGNEFYSFRGIPFAEPPLGRLRFQAPIPKGPWKGILNATEDGPACSQLDFFTLNYMGDEDCLYLNVYTPKLPSKDGKKMDVVYHIHGGGFLAMAGNSLFFGPERFPLDDIVLVSVTYRVAVMGFLSTNDSSSRGNYGLLDQLEGLRWVRNNIDRFGGDPNRVTIFGESAGGASVIYQMLSPLAKGLFHRAIAVSGSAVCQWALQKDPAYWSNKLGKDIGCPTESSEALVECLRSKNTREVVETAAAKFSNLQYLTIVPTLDNYFITDLPIKIIKEKKYQTDVTLIIGMTKNEGNCFFIDRKNSPNDFTDEELSGFLKGIVDARPFMDDKVKLIREEYYPNITSYKEEDILPVLNEVMTDGMFQKCIYLSAKRMAQSGSKTFFFQYDYEAPFGIATISNKSSGVCHSDDLFMFFGGIFKVKSFDDTSETVKNQFQKLYTNFIKNGTPVTSEDKDLCDWPESKHDQLNVYHLNINCSTVTYNEANDFLYKFWVDDVNMLDI